MAELHVLLSNRQKPFDRVLVIVMLLTFHDDLFAAIDKLVSSFGGEVLIRQEMLPLLNVLCSSGFLILR